ncbi:MAG: hypothetical protein M3458_20895 [Acidobacteriota bacterium]|nr:hypothetical protein [Acidobacteriota bacterium]
MSDDLMDDDTLAFGWSATKKALAVGYPLKKWGSVADARFVYQEIFTKKVLDELDRRGYDLSTLKFEIRQTKGTELIRIECLNCGWVGEEKDLKEIQYVPEDDYTIPNETEHVCPRCDSRSWELRGA